MTRSLVVSLMLYPKMRRDMVEVWALVHGQESAHQLAEEVDTAMVAVGKWLRELEQSAMKPGARPVMQSKTSSLELRELAKRHSGPHPSAQQLTGLLNHLADWLEQYSATDRDLHSQN
jgi:hypothetical protein